MGGNNHGRSGRRQEERSRDDVGVSSSARSAELQRGRSPAAATPKPTVASSAPTAAYETDSKIRSSEYSSLSTKHKRDGRFSPERRRSPDRGRRGSFSRDSYKQARQAEAEASRSRTARRREPSEYSTTRPHRTGPSTRLHEDFSPRDRSFTPDRHRRRRSASYESRWRRRSTSVDSREWEYHRDTRRDEYRPRSPYGRRERSSPPASRSRYRDEPYEYYRDTRDTRDDRDDFTIRGRSQLARNPPRDRSHSPSDLISALASGKRLNTLTSEKNLPSTEPVGSRRASRSPRGSRRRDTTDRHHFEADRARRDHDDDDMYGRGGPPRGPYHDPRYAQSPHYPASHQYSPPAQSPYGRGYPPQGAYPSHHGSPVHGYPAQPYYGYPQAGASPYYQGQPAAHYPPPQQASPPPSYNRGPSPAQQPRTSAPRLPGPPPGAQKTKTGHFANLSWTPNNKKADSPTTAKATVPEPATSSTAPADEDDGEDNPFRPPKDLRAEDENAAKAMPPPPAKTDQAEGGRKPISFSIKGAAEKKEAAKPAQIPQPRMVREVVIRRRLKPRPTLSAEHAASDSVYYRKEGNESVVGSGTYGKVYKAVHIYTKEEVALKKIRMEGEKDGFPVTAVREIKILQSLKNVNVVQLLEVMVEKNDCFMVFEYAAHDLTGLINHPTFTLSAAHKKDLARQMFEGLAFLHRRGVLHRDIKAANILVSKSGVLKLADFGLARFFNKRRQGEYTNRVVTIWYRCPELLFGETQYGPAVDIWSAACVLVEIFTRHAIFPGDGGEINQLVKIYDVLGTPSRNTWPKIVDLQWFELLRPIERVANTFAQKYKHRVTPEGYNLLEAMFAWDPESRPSASDVLEHPYFTVEAPAPAQVVELAELEGDWHEFESKALRKEKDREARRKEKEMRDAEKKKAASEKEGVAGGEKRKEAPEGAVAEPEGKRARTVELE